MNFHKIAELAGDMTISEEDRNRVMENCRRYFGSVTAASAGAGCTVPAPGIAEASEYEKKTDVMHAY
ncbi:MAG: hypothetical protein IKE58_04455 [Blautia sp.]|nr:hypothetical protein [Blautia sp.]